MGSSLKYWDFPPVCFCMLKAVSHMWYVEMTQDGGDFWMWHFSVCLCVCCFNSMPVVSGDFVKVVSLRCISWSCKKISWCRICSHCCFRHVCPGIVRIDLVRFKAGRQYKMTKTRLSFFYGCLSWQVCGTPANFNGFRALSSLLQRSRSAEVNLG